MNVDEELRDEGRRLMNNPKVRGVKLIVFMKDGRYNEYNNNFDPLFANNKKQED